MMKKYKILDEETELSKNEMMKIIEATNSKFSQKYKVNIEEGETDQSFDYFTIGFEIRKAGDYPIENELKDFVKHLNSLIDFELFFWKTYIYNDVFYLFISINIDINKSELINKIGNDVFKIKHIYIGKYFLSMTINTNNESLNLEDLFKFHEECNEVIKLKPIRETVLEEWEHIYIYRK